MRERHIYIRINMAGYPEGNREVKEIDIKRARERERQKSLSLLPHVDMASSYSIPPLSQFVRWGRKRVGIGLSSRSQCDIRAPRERVVSSGFFFLRVYTYTLYLYVYVCVCARGEPRPPDNAVTNVLLGCVSVKLYRERRKKKKRTSSQFCRVVFWIAFFVSSFAFSLALCSRRGGPRGYIHTRLLLPSCDARLPRALYRLLYPLSREANWVDVVTALFSRSHTERSVSDVCASNNSWFWENVNCRVGFVYNTYVFIYVLSV